MYSGYFKHWLSRLTIQRGSHSRIGPTQTQCRREYRSKTADCQNTINNLRCVEVAPDALESLRQAVNQLSFIYEPSKVVAAFTVLVPTALFKLCAVMSQWSSNMYYKMSQRKQWARHGRRRKGITWSWEDVRVYISHAFIKNVLSSALNTFVLISVYEAKIWHSSKSAVEQVFTIGKRVSRNVRFLVSGIFVTARAKD